VADRLTQERIVQSAHMRVDDMSRKERCQEEDSRELVACRVC